MKDTRSAVLLPHCTEGTNAAGSPGDWQRVFRRLGLELTVLASGCCGMAGTFGHEARHRPTSERIYALSWQAKGGGPWQGGPVARNRLLVPRSQVKIIDGVVLRHPVQALRTALIGSPA